MRVAGREFVAIANVTVQEAPHYPAHRIKFVAGFAAENPDQVRVVITDLLGSMKYVTKVSVRSVGYATGMEHVAPRRARAGDLGVAS